MNPQTKLENALRGWPDQALTVALIIVALFLVALALWAPSLVKAGALAWAVFP